MKVQTFLRTCWITVALIPCAAYAAFEHAGWIQADDVLVRQEPNPTATVLGVLQRGAEVKYEYFGGGTGPDTGYCEVNVVGYTGHVACRFISSERKTARQAGMGDTDTAMRWVNAKGVNLRERPAQDAPVLVRLNFNNSLRLKQKIEGSAYCEVELPNKKAGFTACAFLSEKPSVLASWNAGVLSTKVNLENISKEFWAKPDWSLLKDYAKLLERKLPPEQRQTGPWPKNDELERMKIRLAKGVAGGEVKKLDDWGQIQADAAKAMVHLQNRIAASGGKKADEMIQGWAQYDEVGRVANYLDSAMTFYGGVFESGSFQRVIAPLYLARAIQLPYVQSSYFKTESEIASPSDQTASLATKFNALNVQRIQQRYVMPKQRVDVNVGIYGITAVSENLSRNISTIRLFRNADTTRQTTNVQVTNQIWPLNYEDDRGCGDYTYGFAFGDSDRSNLAYGFGGSPNEIRKEVDRALAEARKRNPANSLYAFYTSQALPHAQFQMAQSQQTMNRAETGFVRATQFAYDVDHDGIADLIVWEGQGKGPGHLEGPTKTDDRWYRIAFVNIAGRWKILGVDTFGYGCGC